MVISVPTAGPMGFVASPPSITGPCSTLVGDHLPPSLPARGYRHHGAYRRMTLCLRPSRVCLLPGLSLLSVIALPFQPPTSTPLQTSDRQRGRQSHPSNLRVDHDCLIRARSTGSRVRIDATRRVPVPICPPSQPPADRSVCCCCCCGDQHPDPQRGPGPGRWVRDLAFWRGHTRLAWAGARACETPPPLHPPLVVGGRASETISTSDAPANPRGPVCASRGAGDYGVGLYARTSGRARAQALPFVLHLWANLSP